MRHRCGSVAPSGGAVSLSVSPMSLVDDDDASPGLSVSLLSHGVRTLLFFTVSVSRLSSMSASGKRNELNFHSELNYNF